MQIREGCSIKSENNFEKKNIYIFCSIKTENNWNPNCENNYSQFLAILRFSLEWVH